MLALSKERYSTIAQSAPSYSRQLEKTHKCQATVKLPGSFCPRTTRPRLHSHLNFAVYVFKTVAQSFYHSCGSELHDIPRFPSRHRLYLHLIEERIVSFVYLLAPKPFIWYESSTISLKVSFCKCFCVFTIWQTRSNITKSFFFEESNGYFLKKGITFLIKSLMLLTSNL